MSGEAGELWLLQLQREREGCCGHRLFMLFFFFLINLTSIFVHPPNLNQPNIGCAVLWQPAVFFLPLQTCSAVCSNVISIKHHHVDREQLRLTVNVGFLFFRGSGEFGLHSNSNHTYFKICSAGLIDSTKANEAFSCD